MYLLDTNVIYELRRAHTGRADTHVLAWANSVLPAQLHVSAITLLELQLGVHLIERRDPAQGALLSDWLTRQVLPAFKGRVLPVDTAVALRCAGLHVPNPCPERDALIAATALVHGMTVVSRNVADFVRTGVRLLNPWQESSS